MTIASKLQRKLVGEQLDQRCVLSVTFIDSGQQVGDSPVTLGNPVALGDLDGDGDLDAFTLAAGPNGVWLNDGSGTFLDSGQQIGDSNTSDAALADFDADGDLDAFVVNDDHNRLWLNLQPAVGDANRDYRFDQEDVVLVLQAAKYLTGEPATWRQGDWNGDSVFDQEDIVNALQTGNYLQGPYAVDAYDSDIGG